MRKVKLTILESRCRGGYHKARDTFLVDDLCPPLCHELWSSIYPMIYALRCGGELDCGTGKSRSFEAACPDRGRVLIRGEIADG